MTAPDLWERPVTYGAVGGTKAPDLMIYPPAGYRPYEGRVRVGHGDDRWTYAWSMTLSWGIQRGAGFHVRLVETPAEVTEQTYSPVSFDAVGTPVAPASVASAHETVFAPDGSTLIAPGDTAVLGIGFWPFRIAAPARVVYVVDEPDRKGFAYGTLKGHPERGEESFIVERTEDGSVWLEIRAFSRPAAAWGLVYPVLRWTQWFYTRRYFRTLSAPLT